MKTVYTILIIIMLSLASPVSSAAGTMQLTGKIQSFDRKTIELNDGHKVYTLDRSKLPKASTANVKTGASISLNVPFEGILDVKKVKKQ